jgi:hypothetical protein
MRHYYNTIVERISHVIQKQVERGLTRISEHKLKIIPNTAEIKSMRLGVVN